MSEPHDQVDSIRRGNGGWVVVVDDEEHIFTVWDQVIEFLEGILAIDD